MTSPTTTRSGTTEPTMTTNMNREENDNNTMVATTQQQDDAQVSAETQVIPFQMSNTPPAPAPVALRTPSTTQADTPNSMDLIDPSIMADREASLHVTGWVRANYIQEREHNVPRRNMFEHYKAFCTSTGLTPVNSATFGKLLRVVFPELKTRRLGVRGQSKYHYCGIRVRTPEDIVDTTTPALPLPGAPTSVMNQLEYTASPSSSTATPTAGRARYTSGGSPAAGGDNQQRQRGESPTTSPLPIFTIPRITTASPTSEGYRYDTDMAASFTSYYERHCREVFHLVSANQVEKLRQVYMTFYNDMPDHYMRLIQTYPEITEAVWRWDCTMYDTMINTFLPTVTHPLTQDMVRGLRTFTRELREYIEANLNHYPPTFYQKKADVARIFAAKFRRQLSLNFAAQTASTILSMHDHVSAMRQDWERFDFDGILDQTLWVCDCDTNEIRLTLRQEVYTLLTTKTHIDHWMHWLANLVNKYLKKFTPTTIGDANHYLNRSKQLLLKWNFYTSLIMKDLTYQQARSFGSFNSVKIFLDDYLLYLVEENIAAVNFQLMQQQHDAQQAITASVGGPSSSTAGSRYHATSPAAGAST